jgi:predicted dinucleotide-binding enzyme
MSLGEIFPGCKVIDPHESGVAEIVALCVPWHVAKDALSSTGDLSGKVLIDCTNPLNANATELVLGGTTSAAEQIQQWYPQACVVKAFNNLGFVLLGDADFNRQLADGFYCGDDPAAKEIAATLIGNVGWHPVDVDPLRNARYPEAMAMLWINIALHQKRGPDFAFKLISRTKR